MIDRSDPLYAETAAIRRGEAAVAAAVRPTLDWIGATFGIAPLNIGVDRLHDGQPRLMVVFERAADAAAFKDTDGLNYDSAKQAAIAACYVHGAPVEAPFVAFAAFEPVARADANSRMTEAHLTALNAQAAAEGWWRFMPNFDTTTLFSLTEVAARSAVADDAAVVHRYRALLADYDEFGYFAADPIAIALDSKERFERDYHGNWYWYFR